MTSSPMISPLSDLELDAVTGGSRGRGGGGFRFDVRQNARGGDSIAIGGNGGNATATGGLVNIAIGGFGGFAISGPGGNGGTNVIAA
jgi:hypothetical protein